MVSGPVRPAFVGGDGGDPAVEWEAFLRGYTPLLLQVVRLHEHDPDRADDCFVFVCEQLRRDDLRRLRRFEPDGPASFSTWLRAVVRNLCLDWRRKRFGRPRPFRVIQYLSRFDQEVYRAMHLRGLTEDEALEAVRRPFPDASRLDLCDSLGRIERSLSSYQHWLLASTHVREVSLSTPRGGDGDGPVLDPPGDGPSPEDCASHDEEIGALRRALAGLPAEERLLLRLRYEQELTLEQIARLTRIGSAVTAQRRLERAVEKLRKMLGEKDQLLVSVSERQREIRDR